MVDKKVEVLGGYDKSTVVNQDAVCTVCVVAVYTGCIPIAPPSSGMLRGIQYCIHVSMYISARYRVSQPGFSGFIISRCRAEQKQSR
jgi:hypothetical protein